MKTKITFSVLLLVSTMTSFSQTKSSAIIASSNFNIPMVQFMPTKSVDNKKGDVAFFNSIGAGIGISIADLEKYTDSVTKKEITEMKNKIGFQTGFLFSANSSDELNKNKFAWTISLVLLDFQIGYGYEFGTISENQNRNFFNLSYSIPLGKLTKGGSYVFRMKTQNKTFEKVEKGYFF